MRPFWRSKNFEIRKLAFPIYIALSGTCAFSIVTTFVGVGNSVITRTMGSVMRAHPMPIGGRPAARVQRFIYVRSFNGIAEGGVNVVKTLVRIKIAERKK